MGELSRDIQRVVDKVPLRNPVIPEVMVVRSNGCQDTPFGYTMSVIGGKWKMAILYLLSAKPSIRFNEMQRQLGAVTYKVLSAQLKELEADGLGEARGVSADSAQSGVFADTERADPATCVGAVVRVGSTESVRFIHSH